ncbi:MAG TPA: NfeD family protein [Cryptosporangiaceae bacterium]|nr:NfeD family protein [Cryptosporangiaceae bacterium]
MRAWIIWLVVSVGLVIAELFSLDLVLIMFATGALAAAGTAALVEDSLLLQAIVFAVVSALSLGLVRPLARTRLQAGTEEVRHGIDALKAQDALVLERVDEHGGLVKLGGEQWTARSFDATQILEPGQTVQVVDIKGATALVWRQP